MRGTINLNAGFGVVAVPAMPSLCPSHSFLYRWYSLGLLRPETGDPTMLLLRELRIWAVRPRIVSQLSPLGIRGRHRKFCGRGVGAPSFETGRIHLFFPVGLLRQFLVLTALWPLFTTTVFRSVVPFQPLNNVAMVAET